MDLAAIVATLVFAGSVVLGQNILALIMKVPLDTKAYDLGRTWFYRIIGALCLTLYVVTGGKSWHWVPTEIRLIGFPLIGAAIALIFWAQIVLGRNWVGGVGLHRTHKLITSGPYARIRHPIYSGFCLAALGITLASASPLAAAGAGMMACSLLTRIFSEEQLLKQRFKRRFYDYQQRTGWLLPRIRR